MGLFDDLLGTTKTQETVVSAPPMPNVDPMAVMEEKATSTPPEVDVFLNMSAGAVTADMPSYTDRKANGETVTTTTINEEISLTPSVDVTPELNLTSAPIIETTSTIVPEVTETPVLDLFASAEISVPTAEIAPETPVVEVVSEATVATQDSFSLVSENIFDSTASEAPVVSSEVTENATQVEVENNSIFDFSVTENEAKTEENPLVEAVSIEAETQSEIVSDDIFGFATETAENNETPAEAKSEEKIEEKTEENIFAISTENEAKVPESPEFTLSSTSDFIAASLVQLDKMEQSLADRKAEFLSQAEQYRLEKEKFAELEAKALEDSISMDAEQSRITTMRNYFQKQLKQESEITDSVNTALTGIATQKAVGNAMKKSPRTSSKKTVNA